MEEILKAIYEYFKSDTGQNPDGSWLDPDDHRRYAEILGTDEGNFHKHMIPVKQPMLLEENLPIVSFYIANMPANKQIIQLKTIVLDFDIYTEDNTFIHNLKIAKRHFQLLEGKLLEIDLPFVGEWRHVTEMQVPLTVPTYFCYTQRFASTVQRESSITGLKK